MSEQKYISPRCVFNAVIDLSAVTHIITTITWLTLTATTNLTVICLSFIWAATVWGTVLFVIGWLVSDKLGASVRVIIAYRRQSTTD
jgi:hypothetical protein